MVDLITSFLSAEHIRIGFVSEKTLDLFLRVAGVEKLRSNYNSFTVCKVRTLEQGLDAWTDLEACFTVPYQVTGLNGNFDSFLRLEAYAF